MVDRSYNAPASGPAQHRMLFFEDEDEFRDLHSIRSSITELRSQIAAFREYVEEELADMKNDLQHIAGCADYLVLSAGADTLLRASDAVNPDGVKARSENLLLLIRAVFCMVDKILLEGTLVMTEKAFAALVRKNLKEAHESIRDNIDEDVIDKLEHDSSKGVEPRML
jgi:hypothetical protein